jgi:hypothetical protein
MAYGSKDPPLHERRNPGGKQILRCAQDDKFAVMLRTWGAGILRPYKGKAKSRLEDGATKRKPRWKRKPLLQVEF